MPFQTQVNVQPALGVAGDFASANPRFSVIAGQFAFVAGPAGVIVGRFAWADQYNNASVYNTGSGAPTGFVHREQQASIITYLAESSMTILGGQPMTLMSGGDFLVANSGTIESAIGMKAYANNATGLVRFGVTGAALAGASVTGSIAASTASVTGSINNNVLTVTAVGSGTLVPGGTISGTGVATGTKIVEQLSGTTGGVGTYGVSIPEQSVASTTISETYGTMTVTAVGSGAIAVGDTISGSGVTAGTYVSALGTGTGGTGTYIVSPTQTASSTTITVAADTETKWYAMNRAAPGELVKMSDHALG